MSEFRHEPVLLHEALAALNIQADGVYVDATFGRGGHSAAILAQLGPAGRLYAIDRDPEAAAVAQAVAANDERLVFCRGSFTDFSELLAQAGLNRPVNGVLFDLGVSSPQLDDPERGFSFSHDGPLDMRMDPQQGQPVSAWLQQASADEIARVLREYGEERFAGRIARHIVEARLESPLTRTAELAALCARAVPKREPGKHPATRSFQALRIFINDELGAIERALPQARAALLPGGRLAVISFHSLEDRLVKRFIRGAPVLTGRRLPPPVQTEPQLRALGKPVYAGDAELARNPRARSAVLRCAERVA